MGRKGKREEPSEQGRAERPDDRGDRPRAGEARRRAVLYCVVPRELAGKLHEPLRRHFREDPNVKVIVERRVGERRSGEDRRRSVPGAARRRDRRKVRHPGGRRVGERRAAVSAVEPPPLPRKLRRHVHRLAFVRRLEPRGKEAEELDAARLALHAQAGDRAAFASIYMRYFDSVYGYVRMALRDAHEAEDVTQQVFTKAFAALASYERRRGTPFRAWLFRIARNEAISHLRRHARLEYREPSAIGEQLEAEPSPDTAAGTPRPQESFEWLTDKDLLMWVERLPVPQRQALTLRYLLGLSAAEIATVLDRTPEGVRQLEHRALRFLEQRLRQTREGSRSMRRRRMERRVRPLPVLGARRWGLQTGAGRRRAVS